jgi:hypothetical protein
LDDGYIGDNIDDSSVDACIELAIKEADPFGKWLGRVLRVMTEEERAALLATDR